jgi:hypothetical protein
MSGLPFTEKATLLITDINEERPLDPRSVICKIIDPKELGQYPLKLCGQKFAGSISPLYRLTVTDEDARGFLFDAYADDIFWLNLQCDKPDREHWCAECGEFCEWFDRMPWYVKKPREKMLWCYDYGENDSDGEYCANDKDTEENAEEAVRRCREAAEHGLAEAQYSLGCAYRDGAGVEQNFEEAVRWYRKAAEQNLAKAQYELGEAYHSGNGVEQSFEDGAGWYRKAAEQGDAWAQNHLGLAYVDGAGVEQNSEEAAKWIRKAAEQGLTEAQGNLGVAYYRGEGVKRNFAEAAKWFQKAVEQGLAKKRKIRFLWRFTIRELEWSRVLKRPQNGIEKPLNRVRWMRGAISESEIEGLWPKTKS